MKMRTLAGLVLAGLLASSTVLNASMIGDTIIASGNDIGSLGSFNKWAVIGHGDEFLGISAGLVFDFDENSLTVTGDSLSGWHGYGDFVFSGFDDTITGFTIASNTGFAGSIVNNLRFDEHSITLDMSGATRSLGSVLVFNITTATPVPLPSSALLLGSGLLMLGLVRRK